MNKFTSFAILNTRMTSVLNAVDNDRLQETFVNLVYQALIHGNYNPEHMAALRSSKAPGAFKAGVAKYMPITWSKTEEKYSFSSTKVAKLRTSLGIGDSNDFDQLAAALPNLFDKSGKKPAEDSVAKVCKNAAARLEKLGVSNAEGIAALVAMMADKPELVATLAKAALDVSTAQPETEEQAA